ncbi:MAG: carboxymuconolactone decarboxylase family protein [Gemmatimonadota bacterium]
MTLDQQPGLIVRPLDDERVAMVRLAAAVAGGSEPAVRAAVALAVARLRPVWAEEVILQSYLFAGFPRALNAMREFRRASPRQAPAVSSPDNAVAGTAADATEEDSLSYSHADSWQEQGERTCAIVYGRAYDTLRSNINALHPALDRWMIVEGYGKVLSRPGLDLANRELCIVAACAAGGQERQLHSHLHGALHAGSSADELRHVLVAIAGYIDPAERDRYMALLEKVVASHVH